MENNKPSRTSKKDIRVTSSEAFYKVPNPHGIKPKDDNTYHPWGVDNRYPLFALDMRTKSYTHAALLEGKADYTIGDGVAVDGKKLDFKVNPEDSIQDLIRKCVDEYYTYNCFAVEVVYNAFKQPYEFYPVPMHKLRMNNSRTRFWYSHDWLTGRHDHILDKWTPVSEDGSSKIFYFGSYPPSYNEVYPDLPYIHGVQSILNEARIQDFNANTLESHFSPGHIITFHGGSNVSDDQKRKTVQGLNDSFTGVKGKKIIVDFQTPTSPPASVQTLAQPQADIYESTLESSRNAIFVAHQITSPALFGVATAGQLGATQELKTAHGIFMNKFVANKRNEILGAMNTLFAGHKQVRNKMEFLDREMFANEVSDTTREKIMTINELRKEAGKPPIPDGDRLIGSAPTPAVTPQPQAPNQPTAVPTPTPNPNAPTKMFKGEAVELGDEDFDKIADMGSMLEDYELIGEGEYVFSDASAKAVEMKFDMQSEIADYIISNGEQDTTINKLKVAIRKDLGISVTTSELTSTLDSLANAGVIEVSTTGTGVTIKPLTKQDQPNQVEVMYSYTTRAGYGDDIMPTSRPFCRRLIQNGRLYTRAEIQQMSQIFGYDIYAHGGGFYRDPETGEVKTHCRHQWKAWTVARRRK